MLSLIFFPFAGFDTLLRKNFLEAATLNNKLIN